MIESRFEVLVIDDLEDFAKTCAGLIRIACNVNVAIATKPSVAEELVKKNSFKVIVFDYNMPEMTGIELYKRLKRIDPDFKSVLLTIESGDGRILTDAHTLGFNHLMIKGNEDYLLQYRVLSLINQYDAEKYSSEPFYSARIGGWFSKNYIHYYIQSIPPQFFEDDSNDNWDMSDELHEGEKKEISIEEEYSVSKEFSKSFTLSNSFDWTAQIGLPQLCVNEFSMKFSDAMQQIVTQKFIQSRKLTQKKTWTRELPRTGDIVYERYEYAPEFIKARVYVMSVFSWSNKKCIDCLETTFPTGAYKRRIYRLYRDGNDEHIPLPPSRAPGTNNDT